MDKAAKVFGVVMAIYDCPVPLGGVGQDVRDTPTEQEVSDRIHWRFAFLFLWL
jgi:hypothetical protein